MSLLLLHARKWALTAQSNQELLTVDNCAVQHGCGEMQLVASTQFFQAQASARALQLEQLQLAQISC